MSAPPGALPACPGAATSYRTILVPLDGSPLAERALPYAVALATHHGSTLVLVEAVAPASPHGAGSAQALRSSAEAHRYLARWRVRLEAACGVSVEAAVVFGAADREIVGEVLRRDADLVVMSTHGRSGIERALMGSVADYVQHHASVPVLLIPPTCSRDWDVAA
jgi:nucleotide-binding universal stress UspA family protein